MLQVAILQCNKRQGMCLLQVSNNHKVLLTLHKLTSSTVMSYMQELPMLGRMYPYIAICSQSGSGKPTIINTMGGLLQTEKGACKIGVTETTHSVQTPVNAL